MKVLRDGVLMTYMESFYDAADDHERALCGACIIGYLEALLYDHLQAMEKHSEASSKEVITQEWLNEWLKRENVNLDTPVGEMLLAWGAEHGAFDEEDEDEEEFD